MTQDETGMDIGCVDAAKQFAKYLKVRPPASPRWVRNSWHAVTKDEDDAFKSVGLRKLVDRDAWIIAFRMGTRLGKAIGEYPYHGHPLSMPREKFEGLFIPDGLEAGVQALNDKYLVPDGYKYVIVDPLFEYNAMEWLAHEVYARRECEEFNLLDNISVRIGERDDVHLSKDARAAFVVRGYLP